LKIQIAFQTIHMIGNSPNAAPSRATSIACPNGIDQKRTAVTIATPSEISPAQCDFSFSPPSSTNNVIRGIMATSALRNSESPTGSSTCLYIVRTPPEGT
jgi:hypothetical protein